ncbi:hypothetical protein AYI69_g7368, partial [Smittium culicis]
MSSKPSLDIFLSLYKSLQDQIVSDLANFEANEEMVLRIKT